MLNKRITIILVVLMIVLGVNVNAIENTFNADISVTTTTLKTEDEVVLTISISDINMGENGINILEGTLKYDTNIFESVKASDIQSLNNWSTTYNDENTSLNGKFLAVNFTSGIQEKTKIFSIKLKVKKEIAKTTTTQIEFKDLTSNDGENLVNIGDKSVKLTINVEQKEEIQEPQEPEIPIELPSTEAPGTLPQTGESIIIALTILIIILIGIMVAIKYKKMRDIK